MNKVFAVLGLLSVLCFGACSDDEDPTYYVYATVDGEKVDWKGVQVNAVSVDTAGTMVIEALKTPGITNVQQLTLTLDNFDGENTYPVDLITKTLGAYVYKGTSSNTTGLSYWGGGIVTSYDGEIIEGTFDLTLKAGNEGSDIEITDGSFRAKVRL